VLLLIQVLSVYFQIFSEIGNSYKIRVQIDLQNTIHVQESLVLRSLPQKRGRIPDSLIDLNIS